MKERSLYLKNRFLSVALIFVLSVSYVLVGNITANASLVIDKEAADATYINIDGTPIWYEPGVTAEEQAEAVIGWYLVPYGVKEKFEYYEGKIYLTTATSEDAVGTAFPSELSYKMSTGVISERLTDPYVTVSTSTDDIALVVLHEVGHIFDMTIALFESGTYDGTFYEISDSENWQMLYAKYYDTIINLDYRCSYICNLNAGQAFAELFRMYCEDPYLLASNIPEIYLYIQSLIEAYT